MAKKMSEKSIRRIVIILALLVLVGIISIIVFSAIFFNDLTKESDEQSSLSNTTNTSENELITQSVEDYNYPVFDETKIVKTTGNIDKEVSYTIKELDNQGIFSASISDNKVYVELEDINNKFNDLYKNANLTKNQTYEVKNITEKVIDIHFGYIGNDFNRLFLILLCENGDVRYIDLSTSNTLNGEFLVNDNVIAKNIVRIENVIMKDSDGESNSIILISNNGTSYSMQDLI